jgi:hypothetical protein
MGVGRQCVCVAFSVATQWTNNRRGTTAWRDKGLDGGLSRQINII